jgi:D-aspartate ligase
MENIKYKGFAEIDMKYDARDKKFKVLEINARQGRCSYYLTPLGCNLIEIMVDDLILNKKLEKRILEDEVLLTFVPKGIIKKYCENNDFIKETNLLWQRKKIVKPMDCKLDKNFKRFLQLRKRWLHYYLEYKNSYWK